MAFIWSMITEHHNEENGPFETYLLVTCKQTGENWAMEIGPRMTLDLKRLIKRFLKTEFTGEVALDGDLCAGYSGHYYASIITDKRPIDTIACWDSAGFFTKTTYNS